MALFGSFCGLEIDTFLGDLPFFQISTLLLLVNVLSIMLVPLMTYMAAASAQRLWANRAAKTGILVLNAMYFHLVAFLLLYKAARGIDFDFYFFWYNMSDALPVLWKLYAPWFPAVVLSVAGFIFLQKPAFSPIMNAVKRAPRKAGLFLMAIFACSVFCQCATFHAIRGSTAGFLYASFFSNRNLRSDYRKLYREHIEARRSDAPRTANQGNPSVMGDAIFFIKQESLNGLLVGPKITPQLLRASRDGIRFEKFYANSIQSIRGYECILCGVPPNLTGALVDEFSPRELKDLGCLPRIFKALGYRSLYFFGGSRNPRIMRFAESIGFDEVLADDIVQPEDIKFDWGYREDIFFTRVFEYLQQNHVHDKIFVFIDTGATNHTPFKVLDDTLLNKVPFPQPKKFEEHLANTTFVQDVYFGHLYDLFRERYANRGSLLLASDHSWPIPIHKHNIYNERGAYEENFMATMVFVPPASMKERFATGTTVKERFSQMDIFPTVLNLLGLEEKQPLGESFAPWLLAARNGKPSEPRKTKISIQPYGGGYISAVCYPEKYLFDVLGQRVKIFDLEKDPGELSPVVRSTEEYASLITEFFQNESFSQRK